MVIALRSQSPNKELHESARALADALRLTRPRRGEVARRGEYGAELGHDGATVRAAQDRSAAPVAEECVPLAVRTD